MRICDYSDTDYEQQFWKGTGREYEDAADKIAVLKLLPSKGDRILELGAGFGRLANVYHPRFQNIVLFDYAQNLLDKAKWHFGDNPKFNYQQGSVYELPYEAFFADTVLMVRVSHHLDDIKKVLHEAFRVLKPHGVFVLEYANKRNVKEIIRFLFGRSKVNPFSVSVEDRTSKGFYNYHPAYIEQLIKEEGFHIEQVLSVSNFRWNVFKKILGPDFLLFLEARLQSLLASVRFGPSIYVKLRKT